MALAEAYLFSNDYSKSKELLLPLLNEKTVVWQTYELLGRIELEENKASVKLPFELPLPVVEVFSKKIQEILKLEVNFSKEEAVKEQPTSAQQ